MSLITKHFGAGIVGEKHNNSAHNFNRIALNLIQMLGNWPGVGMCSMANILFGSYVGGKDNYL